MSRKTRLVPERSEVSSGGRGGVFCSRTLSEKIEAGIGVICGNFV